MSFDSRRVTRRGSRLAAGPRLLQARDAFAMWLEQLGRIRLAEIPGRGEQDLVVRVGRAIGRHEVEAEYGEFGWYGVSSVKAPVGPSEPYTSSVETW